ncbi:MAG: DUF444 family protein [Planctomycetes bacterium]|nr:DUF444 family protein [Planctomycetota bacterium]
MVRKIDKDKTRFDQIVRGKIKRNLQKYISGKEMIGRKGRNIVSIPIPQIELPRFKYGNNKKDGVGQGEGESGKPVDGDGKGQAGDQSGRHVLEVEVTLEELAKILGEELELPRIEPRGKENITSVSGRYTGIRNVGPESLRHFKRTFKEALKRQLTAGLYDPDDPVIIPFRGDNRYRSWKERQNPENNAVIIYMMDVSGSMGKEQKDVVRLEAFWIDTWLRSQYKNIERRFIVHDAAAKEVDEHTFFHLRESGGTKISSALEVCAQLIREKFHPTEWNIYPFHFSDGDNWSSRDTEKCVDILKDELLLACNVFCYGQVKSAYGSGQFKKDLDKVFRDDDRVITSDIPDRDGIMNSIKDFLGKGK